MLKLIGFIVCVVLIFSSIDFSRNNIQAKNLQQSILLENLDGTQQTLDEYIGHGKWVVVNVWATACPFCREELFDLANFHDRHQNKDAIVLGLTLDLATFGFPDKDYLTGFAESYLIEYPLFLVNGDIASQVIGKPINRIPMTLFYNPEGKLVYQLNSMVNEAVLEGVIQNKQPAHTGAAEATHVNNPNLK